jgi:uncharacterized coiled-coil DUF342 family protein
LQNRVKGLSETLTKSSQTEALVKTFQDEINRLRVELQDEIDEHNTLKGAFEAQKVFLGQKDLESKEIEDKRKDDLQSLKLAMEKIEEMKKKKNELEAKNNELETEKNKISLNFRLEKEMIRSQLEGLADKEKEEKSKLEINIQELNQNIQEMEKKINELNQEVQEMNIDLNTLNQEKIDLNQEIEKLKLK